MLSDLNEAAPVCQSQDCERPLGQPALVFATEAGRRRVYECECGAVTVTVAARKSSR